MEHRTPSLPGSSRQDSPSLTGWGTAVLSGVQEVAVNDTERDLFRENWEFLSSDLVMPDAGKGVESPIERAFVRCFAYLMIGMDEKHRKSISIRPQVKFGKYVADVVIYGVGDAVLLVIECDGHDYHAGDKAGAGRDRERDRWFVSQGYAVYRFTGTQIYQRPFLCAADAIGFALRKLEGKNA